MRKVLKLNNQIAVANVHDYHFSDNESNDENDDEHNDFNDDQPT